MIGGTFASAEAATEDLSARYASAYRVAYRLIGDPAVADVLARDALVWAAAGASKVRRRSIDASACLRVAALALRDELWLGRPRSPQGGTGFGEVSHREERRRLRMAVRSLLGRQRQVFVLEHARRLVDRRGVARTLAHSGGPSAHLGEGTGQRPQAL